MVTNHATEYALLGLIFLAKNKEKRVKIADIAEAENIPLTFLQKIFQKLRKAGIVVASVGPQGGYQLARSPREINLREVFVVIHAHHEQCEQTALSLKKHPSGKNIITFIEQLHADLLVYLEKHTLQHLLKH